MKEFICKQEIFTEGDKASYFFIVYEGEVELTKKVVTRHPKEIDAQKYKHEPKNTNFKGKEYA